MCKLPLRKYFNYIRFLLVFAVTLVIGLWLTGFFESYSVRFSVERTFTIQEADALAGKKVTIRHPNREPREGTVTGYNTFGKVIQLKICCQTFERIERNENVESQFNKYSFDEYVTVADQ